MVDHEAGHVDNLMFHGLAQQIILDVLRLFDPGLDRVELLVMGESGVLKDGFRYAEKVKIIQGNASMEKHHGHWPQNRIPAFYQVLHGASGHIGRAQVRREQGIGFKRTVCGLVNHLDP
jgi:hypothetical protein